MTQSQDRAAVSGDIINCSISDSFAQWMSRAGGSLVVTTYQAGKVAMIGWDGRQVTLLMRQFEKPMGMAISGKRLALATRNDIVLLANANLLARDYMEQQPGRYDALYLPRVSYHTGDLNIHDLAFGNDGLWVVNTRFCCLSRLSDEFNFVPVWKPPFLTDIVPEDRCHLNGLTVVDGKPKYVTCLGETDVVGGWRPGKATGGCVIDVPNNQVIARGFAMPHSPRWYRNQLYLLHSGAGELITVDPKSGKHMVVCALPAYLRGLGFVGDFAIVGMCQIREKHIFGGLRVQQRYQKLLCGIAIINLTSGSVVGTFEFTSGCQELFEVQFLPGILRPMILNLQRDEGKLAFSAPEFSYWLRPSNEIKDPPSQQ
ncbi:MAG TPA: TIGR03032 family protein [Tepidisphaeraceae bacterium]|nr:TIGR03032 family protein [Tepidisphaeraceae bacterium]